MIGKSSTTEPHPQPLSLRDRNTHCESEQTLSLPKATLRIQPSAWRGDALVNVPPCAEDAHYRNRGDFDFPCRNVLTVSFLGQLFLQPLVICLLPAADLGTNSPETLSVVLTTMSCLRTVSWGPPVLLFPAAEP
jgi:hypothetical protein